jgi:hypothetical protein
LTSPSSSLITGPPYSHLWLVLPLPLLRFSLFPFMTVPSSFFPLWTNLNLLFTVWSILPIPLITVFLYPINDPPCIIRPPSPCYTWSFWWFTFPSHPLSIFILCFSLLDLAFPSLQY